MNYSWCVTNRSWVIWSILLLCAAIIFGTMAWMSRGVIRSEQDRVHAQAQAQVSERVGLALSRMDTIGAALLVVENQRPPLHYEAFFHLMMSSLPKQQGFAKTKFYEPRHS